MSAELTEEQVAEWLADQTQWLRESAGTSMARIELVAKSYREGDPEREWTLYTPDGPFTRGEKLAEVISRHVVTVAPAALATQYRAQAADLLARASALEGATEPTHGPTTQA